MTWPLNSSRSQKANTRTICTAPDLVLLLPLRRRSAANSTPPIPSRLTLENGVPRVALVHIRRAGQTALSITTYVQYGGTWYSINIPASLTFPDNQ
jgi:hypothetical protein